MTTIYLEDILVENKKKEPDGLNIFAKEHLHLTKQDWSKVLWSDESKYHLFSPDDGLSMLEIQKTKEKTSSALYQQ